MAQVVLFIVVLGTEPYARHALCHPATLLVRILI
jgi:hypothetical protein